MVQAVLDGADAAIPGIPVADTIKQVDADGAMKAVIVWQQINEAIQLVRALEDRLSGRARRKQ